MSNNLAVKVTADIADAQAKLAVLNAEFRATQTQINALARAGASGSLGTIGEQQLRSLTQRSLELQAAAQPLAVSINEAGFAVKGLGAAALSAGHDVGSTHGSVATATREFRALFDELSSGRTRQTPGTLAIIAQRVLGISGATLAAIGGVAALAGGLAYLAFRSLQASQAIDQIHLASLEAGNDISRLQFQQLTEQLAKLPGVSESAAREIIAAFDHLHMPMDSFTAATRIAAEQMSLTGEKADKVGEQMARALDPNKKAIEVAKDIAELTQAQVDQAKAADASHNANDILAVKLGLLASQLRSARAGTGEYYHSLGQITEGFLDWIGLTQEGMTPQQASTELIKEQADAWRQNAAAIQQAKTATALSGHSPKALNFDENSPASQLREQMAEVAAVWDGSQSGLLSKQRALAAQFLAQTQAGSKEYLEIRREEARLDAQIRHAQGQEALATARTQISELQGNVSQGNVARLQSEQSVWRELLTDEHLTAAQRLEAQRSFNQSSAALSRERQSQAREIERSDADTDIVISRLKIDAQKQVLAAEVINDRVAGTQRLEALRQLTQQESALDIDRLQSEMATLQQGTAEYERVYNQIRELKARLNVDLGSLDRQYASQTNKDAKEQITAWRGAVNEIESAEGGMVNDLLSKRKSLSQSLLQIGANLVSQEITNDLRAMTTRIAFAGTEEAQKRALEQGGFLYHKLIESQKQASTAASEAAQTAATTAGNTARLVSTTSTAAASRAVSKTVGGSTVMADAAKAFSGTYASVAQIPYVGWILAPAAATAAYAAVAAYEGLASLDVGTPYIPQTGLYTLHQGEAVMPKTFAQGMRDGDMGGLGGAETHHYHGDVNLSGSNDMLRQLANRRTAAGAARALFKAYRRGASV